MFKFAANFSLLKPYPNSTLNIFSFSASALISVLLKRPKTALKFAAFSKYPTFPKKLC
jgi:hypothetical protein